MKLIIASLISYCLIFQTALFAQPSIIWNKSYGGTMEDYGNNVIRCGDGNLLIIGTHESTDGDVSNALGFPGSGDVWLLKTDTLGSIIWEKSYGGLYDEDGLAGCETSDHGFLIAAQSNIDDGQVHGSIWGGDYWIVKLDSSGNFLWSKCLGSQGYDKISEIHETQNHEIIVGGTIEGDGGNIAPLSWHGSDDFWIIKLSANGSLLWQKTIGGVGGDFCNSVKQLTDGNFLVSGSVAINSNIPGNHGSDDCAVFKLDNITGNIIWQKCYGGTNSDYGAIVLPDIYNGFYMAATSNSNDGDISGNNGIPNIWLVHCDSTGNIIWSKCYGTIGMEILYDAKITMDNGIIAVGSTDNCSNKDFYVLKVDSNQNLEWSNCYGGSNDEIAHSIIEVSQNKFLVIGNTNSIDGNVSFNHDSLNSTNDIWALMLGANPLNISSIDNELKNIRVINQLNSIIVSFNSDKNFPCTLEIYDIMSIKISQSDQYAFAGTNTFDLQSDLKPGIYFLRLTINNHSVSKSFVFEN